MLNLLLFVLLAASLSTEAKPEEYDLAITNADIAPDGFTRP
jgi:hypothetical protein